MNLATPKEVGQLPHILHARRNLKLKGIDGELHKRWSMWLNSIVTEKPYQGLISLVPIEKSTGFRKERDDRYCMVVVSSCCEMFP